jgi:hypothetical protein
MQSADICVVVGRVGKDCSFEIGWFYGRYIPIYFVPAGDLTYDLSPMLRPALEFIIHNPAITGQVVVLNEQQLDYPQRYNEST